MSNFLRLTLKEKSMIVESDFLDWHIADQVTDSDTEFAKGLKYMR